jgi:hypothetical protein
MSHVVFIGGVGSSPAQIEAVVAELSNDYAQVTGFSFREAYQSPSELARIAKDALVVTHSAGMVLLQETAPREIIAIAPPTILHPGRLLIRSVVKTQSLLASAKQSPERRKQVKLYHQRAFLEHMRYPRYNSMMISKVGSFNAFDSAISHVSNGVTVTLVLMDNDKIFYMPPEDVVTQIENSGVNIKTVSGEHDEFVVDPRFVIDYLSL